jgi:Ulp1 family protease
MSSNVVDFTLAVLNKATSYQIKSSSQLRKETTLFFSIDFSTLLFSQGAESVKNWTYNFPKNGDIPTVKTNMDIYSYGRVFIPIALNNHFLCVVVDIPGKMFTLFDSNTAKRTAEQSDNIINTVQDWLKREYGMNKYAAGEPIAEAMESFAINYEASLIQLNHFFLYLFRPVTLLSCSVSVS